eukprot:TRINITY_DN3124_c0_g1_i1.p1 TRINITY_DN3124_c0_g1~~TRINITY_DN3124_c0_g1_i1.p1  ORF type:complete len:189 (-),score=32.83 TRINITY_DN3124_c0_g1_i1:54-620(-)
MWQALNHFKKYRQGGGIVIFNNKGEVLIGCRTARKKSDIGTWQFPQGGYEPHKDGNRYNGVVREIHEEVGLDALKDLVFVKEIPKTLHYDITEKISIHKGQEIVYFLFFWEEADVSKCVLDNDPPPEFSQVLFKDWDFLLENVAPSKRSMYGELRELSVPIITKFLEEQDRESDHSSRSDRSSSGSSD